MQVSGSVDMQFCFSVLFFVLLTAQITYRVAAHCWRRVAGGRPSGDSPEAYAAQVERLKREEREG